MMPIPMLSVAQTGLLLPYYHYVNDQSPPHLRQLYAGRSRADFTADITWLLQRYTPISLDDLQASLASGKPLPRNCFHLTFDDGFRECHDVIAPVLVRLGVPATFFICSAFLDNKQMFYRNKISLLLDKFSAGLTPSQDLAVKTLVATRGVSYSGLCPLLRTISSPQAVLVDKIAELLAFSFDDYLETERPYLSSGQVDDLLMQGFSIGAHSVDHPRYQELTVEQQINQTRASMAFLIKRFPISCRAFAFPHSDAGITVSFFRALSSEVDLFFGTSRLKKDSYGRCFQRFSLEGSRYTGEEIIKANLLKQAMKGILGRGYIQRKP